MDSAGKSWEVLQNALGEVGKLAGDVGDGEWKDVDDVMCFFSREQERGRKGDWRRGKSSTIHSLTIQAISLFALNIDLLKSNPELKKQYESLQSAAAAYGPEAKKQIDDVSSQVKEILAGGLSFSSITKLQTLIKDKSEMIAKLGDQAWEKGLKEAQPYLEKSPQIKEYLEKNKDALKNGQVNVMELFQKVSSGNIDQLKEYGDSILEKGKEGAKSMGLEKYLGMLPNGSEIMEKAQALQNVADKHGKEVSGRLLPYQSGARATSPETQRDYRLTLCSV